MPSQHSAQRGRPVASSVPCAQCQSGVDPIRAPRVSAYDASFYYFCSAQCQLAFAERAAKSAEQAAKSAVEAVSSSRSDSMDKERRDHPQALSKALYEVATESILELPFDATRSASAPVSLDPMFSGRIAAVPSLPSNSDLDVGNLLLILSIVGSLLALALTLAGDTGIALIARLVVVGVAAIALVFELSLAPRNALSLPIIVQSWPSIASVIIAATACLIGHKEASSLTNAASLVVAATAANVLLILKCRTAVDAERSQLKLALDQDANRYHDESITVVSSQDLRPGEEIVVGPGETVPADGSVVAGQAQVVPWHQSNEQVTVTEGTSVVAGAKVIEGRLRLIVSWSGYDRAWLRLTVDPRRRADLHGVWAKTGRLIALRLAPVVAGLTALTVYAAGQSPLEILGVAVASYCAFCSAGLAELPALHVARGVFAALRRGIAFRSSEAIDRAGRVSTATFCARGTLLLGEPEVTGIDPFGSNTAERVLELAAGAQSGFQDPTATAILRAARARGVRADAVRSPAFFPGLGVTAVASDGQRLIVGSRGLMLREYVSVALSETKIADLEAMGRSVLLVALGARIIGAIGLQDGMRAGARAAVQHLLDVQIEPVLLSGDTRDTCEALGQALDIDHVRPEVLPGDRGDEIRRLADGGAVVAVIGRSPVDDAALSAADLAVALACAGAGSTDWHVQLASDDVRDAAYALRVGHHVRKELWLSLLSCVGTAVAGAAVIAFALLPIGAAPAVALLGVLAGIYRWRSVTE
jgi:Cu+-exporting ATPase